MNNYEEIVGIKTRFENSTETDLINYLNSFYNKWVFNNNKSIQTFIKKACQNFGIIEETFTYDELNINYKKCLYNIVYLEHSVRTKITSDNSSNELEEYEKMFNKIYESIDYSCKMLRMGNIIVNSHSDEGINISDDLGQLRFLEPTIETNSPFQNLLLFYLIQFIQLGYKDIKHLCMKKLIIMDTLLMLGRKK